MQFSKITLKNWKNFQEVDIQVGDRVYLVGPNASGKSNFLDAIRFLRDVARREGGGLQKAINDRGGLSKIRCLAARRNPNVELDVTMTENSVEVWRYALGIKQEVRGKRDAIIAFEKVWKNDELIVDRPNLEDQKDELRKTQTYLEQVNANSQFREIATFLQNISYLHMVPQLLRHPELVASSSEFEDYFGRTLLEDIVQTDKRTKASRLRKIQRALQIAVPQLKELSDVRDEKGNPHLEAVYEHWRAQGSRQREDQFSDGTLRLIGLLWSLFRGEAPLLLEEPELSLNAGIVENIPQMINRILKDTKKSRQIFISTHSAELLTDRSISSDEVLLLEPSKEGTEIKVASSIEDVKLLMEGGLSAADAVLPYAKPKNVEQLGLFE